MKESNTLYDDTYCLEKIKESDEYFFNLIFERYRNRLFNYLYKILKSKEVSEEIVLDVFLKLWQGREAILEIENFEGFLFKVAHNKAIDFFRATKRSPALQEAIWSVIEASDSEERADTQILVKNTNELIREAINQLSPQRRKIFELRNNEELSYSEIATNLQLSTHTVRNQIAASVQFIRQYLQKNSALAVPLVWYLKYFFK